MANSIHSQAELISASNDHEWVLLDFWASWCVPCKSMAPVFDSVADEREDSLFAAKVDVDQAAELASQFQIRGVPTLALLRNGKPVAQIVGAQPKSAIDSWLDAQTSKAA